MRAQVKKRCEAKPLRLGHDLRPGYRSVEPHPEPLGRVGIAQASQRSLPDDLGRNPPLTLGLVAGIFTRHGKPAGRHPLSEE